MIIHEFVDLRSYHTFRLQVKARYFGIVESLDDLMEALNFAKNNELSTLVLGEGSNILFRSDYPGLVLKIELKGKEKKSETEDHGYFKMQAGENWHDLVIDTLKNHYYGLENLALIPGTVGAAPIQNIGAYGVELSDFFVELEAIHRQTLERVTLTHADCQFAYRDSIFKNRYREQFVITSVSLRLHKKMQPNMTYAELKQCVEQQNLPVTSETIFKTVCDIRQRKLPDPKVTPNVGSFFKNPQLEKSDFEKLLKRYPEIKFFTIDEMHVKISAAWLIEQCGFKGLQKNGAGVSKNHTLVLINADNSTIDALFSLAETIEKTVSNRFGVQLEKEPFIYP